MIDDLLRDMRQLREADTLLGQLWLRLTVRRSGLYVLAGLIATLGLGMGNFAWYLGLTISLGPIWAAATLALADFIIATAVFAFATTSELGLDLDAALRDRQKAVDAIEVDSRQVRETIDGLRQEVREIRDNVAAFVHNPLDTAAQKLLIPAAMSVLNGLRSGKKEGS